jgi:NADPH-dependent ferric siderophore reductase
MPLVRPDHDDDDVSEQEGTDATWISVHDRLVGRGALSVHITRTSEGVAVDLYPHGREGEASPLARAFAYFSEALGR